MPVSLRLMRAIRNSYSKSAKTRSMQHTGNAGAKAIVVPTGECSQPTHEKVNVVVPRKVDNKAFEGYDPQPLCLCPQASGAHSLYESDSFFCVENLEIEKHSPRKACDKADQQQQAAAGNVRISSTGSQPRRRSARRTWTPMPWFNPIETVLLISGGQYVQVEAALNDIEVAFRWRGERSGIQRHLASTRQRRLVVSSGKQGWARVYMAQGGAATTPGKYAQPWSRPNGGTCAARDNTNGPYHQAVSVFVCLLPEAGTMTVPYSHELCQRVACGSTGETISNTANANAKHARKAISVNLCWAILATENWFDVMIP